MTKILNHFWTLILTCVFTQVFCFIGTAQDSVESNSGIYPTDLIRTEKSTVRYSVSVYKDGKYKTGNLAQVQRMGANHLVIVENNGEVVIKDVPYGEQVFVVSYLDYPITFDTIMVNQPSYSRSIKLHPIEQFIPEVDVKVDKKEKDFSYKIKDIDGVLVTKGRKTEQVNLDDENGNKAGNIGRQLYAKVPGLNIWESDGAGMQLGIGGRGLNPSRTSNFNTRQNGYDISADALGYPESYYTPAVDAVERIQVVRGAASLQFGTQFGGLLNFVMKEGGPERIKMTFKQTRGSYDFDNTFLSFGGTLKTTKYYVYGNYKNGLDFRPNSGFESIAGGMHLHYQLRKRTNLKIEVTKMSYVAQQPGGLTDLQFAADPSVSFRERNWFKVDWNLGALVLNHKFVDGSKLNVRNFALVASRDALGFLGQINRVDPLEERTLISGYYRNFGNETRYLKQYHVGENVWSLLLGGRAYRGYSEGRQDFGSAASDADFNFISDSIKGSSYNFPSLNFALFAEHIFQFSDRFSIVPGVRYEHISTNANGQYYSSVTNLVGDIISDSLHTDQRSNIRNLVIGGIGFNLDLTKKDSLKTSSKRRLYANFSQNYRSINFTDMQIQNQNFVIDPDLQDETGFNIDLGFQGSNSNLFYYDVSAFLLYYDNRIGTVIQTDTVLFNTYQYRTNIAKSVTQGIEAFAEVDLLRLMVNDSSEHSLRLFLNASVIDGVYNSDDQPAIDGKKVELVPPVNIKTGLKYSFKELQLACQLSYTHEHYSDATNSESQANAVNGIIPSYMISDISAKYNWKKFTLGAGINNLLDESYFTRRATGYPGPGIIPSMPRNFYVSLKFEL